MKVLDLKCGVGHAFEGWFASHDAFEEQKAAGLVECPMCGDKAVAKQLSAPRLNLGAAPTPVAVQPSSQEERQAAQAAMQVQGRWLRAVRELIAATEDVGDRFADEARRIHHGDAPERGIRGQATREETEALADEGIAVMQVALPKALKETLQ
ncbi:DUF1178 family protein [Variovorax dokdonensis]|uniref:DUF1178 family protein n=1 Tax=Variovorax dokdonensis TaxID=344883 RepID=A0ABT7NEN9_9BURK|nr:DUF1178 family protein [Variovorax dokdonensis]MDM0046413.1 DUF1178 family protein [Variovorax dokdonensis]